jgi:hypothetical protein
MAFNTMLPGGYGSVQWVWLSAYVTGLLNWLTGVQYPSVYVCVDPLPCSFGLPPAQD